MMEAIIASAFESNMVYRPNYIIPQYRSTMMELYAKDVASAVPHELPRVMYHPSNRRGGEHEATALPQEGRAALFARELRFSLAIVEFELDTVHECFSRSFKGCNIKCCWSLGKHYELRPPLHVGYGLGQWYALTRAKKGPIGLEYEKKFFE